MKKNKVFTDKARYLLQCAICLVFLVNTDITAAQLLDEYSKYLSKEVTETCRAVQNIAIPTYRGNASSKQALAHCDPYELYFGFNNPPDYVKARECALFTNDYGTLTMVYANGKGVKANLDIALHYACMIDRAAPAEIENRINYLKRLKKEGSKIDFNICDYITSGYMMGECASLGQRSADAKQNRHLNELKKSLNHKEVIALQGILKASARYFSSRTENEMDQFGTGATAFGILEEMNLNYKMVKLLDKVMLCSLQPYNALDYRKEDMELNRLYKKTQHMREYEMSIKRKGVKKTEIAWIKYKDAWINFFKIKCSHSDVNSIKTLVTKERSQLLKELA